MYKALSASISQKTAMLEDAGIYTVPLIEPGEAEAEAIPGLPNWVRGKLIHHGCVKSFDFPTGSSMKISGCNLSAFDQSHHSHPHPILCDTEVWKASVTTCPKHRRN